ncbi:MAG: ABC transporter permease [Methylococcaceae bacterium]|nr:ABC transporter permease [Methylococcaceae bacterium]
MPKPHLQCQYHILPHKNGCLELQLSGDWVIGNNLPSMNDVQTQLDQDPATTHIKISSTELGMWDSRLVSFILILTKSLNDKKIAFDISGLPSGTKSLLKLATAVPERTGVRKTRQQKSFLEILGSGAINTISETKAILSFIGEIWLSFFRFIQGKARFRYQDFWLVIQECGPNALPIVTLISLLIGLILAFIGAIQLQLFGADIYVANLVAIGMTREMGAMMTAIIMAGRTGAAFAAKLGTMQVNEEINALNTMGIAALDFLVLPRILALVLMMPLLTIYSNIIGILGGMWVAVTMLDISLIEYYLQTKQSITLVDCATGIIKSLVFGLLIAGIGCMSGLKCGRSSAAVGEATTTAVVRSIVSIVVADSIFTILFQSLGI